jgi:hypothetical protein
MIVEEKIEILVRYGEADPNRRLHFFLDFPDLRSAFQDIERKDLAAQIVSRSLCGRRNKGKRPYLSTLLSRIMEISVLKNLRKSLKPYGYGDVANLFRQFSTRSFKERSSPGSVSLNRRNPLR